MTGCATLEFPNSAYNRPKRYLLSTGRQYSGKFHPSVSWIHTHDASEYSRCSAKKARVPSLRLKKYARIRLSQIRLTTPDLHGTCNFTSSSFVRERRGLQGVCQMVVNFMCPYVPTEPEAKKPGSLLKRLDRHRHLSICGRPNYTVFCPCSPETKIDQSDYSPHHRAVILHTKPRTKLSINKQQRAIHGSDSFPNCPSFFEIK